MVYTAVKEIAVVGNEDIAFLFPQIAGDEFPRICIQVVSGLIDQQEVPFVKEKCGEQGFRLLSVGKGHERPV